MIAPIRMPRKISTRMIESSTGVLCASVSAKPEKLSIGVAGGQRRRDPVRLDVGVEPDEDRGEADEAVEARDQLGHLGHLHPADATKAPTAPPMITIGASSQ